MREKLGSTYPYSGPRRTSIWDSSSEEVHGRYGHDREVKRGEEIGRDERGNQSQFRRCRERIVSDPCGAGASEILDTGKGKA